MNILELLEKAGFKQTHNYANEVDQIQAQLDLKFSEDFKQYLINYGQLTINDTELCGVFENSHLSVLKLTNEYKKIIKYDQNDLYVIEVLGFDEIVIWQNSQGEIFQTKAMSAPEKIQNSFVEYLKNEVM